MKKYYFLNHHRDLFSIYVKILKTTFHVSFLP